MLQGRTPVPPHGDYQAWRIIVVAKRKTPVRILDHIKYVARDTRVRDPEWIDLKLMEQRKEESTDRLTHEAVLRRKR